MQSWLRPSSFAWLPPNRLVLRRPNYFGWSSSPSCSAHQRKALRGFAGLLFDGCRIETSQDQVPYPWPTANVFPQHTSRIIERSNEDNRRAGKLQAGSNGNVTRAPP
jgi:hypothetical protein